MLSLIKKVVPYPKRWYAKDLLICIYNKERKKYPKKTDHQYIQMRDRKLKRLYKECKASKTLIEVLKEYYDNLKKEDA